MLTNGLMDFTVQIDKVPLTFSFSILAITISAFNHRLLLLRIDKIGHQCKLGWVL